MANLDIGLIVCPCCDFDGAHVRETVKKKAYIICDECSSQSFARGSVSDASIRRRMRPVSAAVQPDPPPDAPPAPKPKKRAAAAVSPAPTPAPKKEDLKSWLNL